MVLFENFLYQVIDSCYPKNVTQEDFMNGKHEKSFQFQNLARTINEQGKKNHLKDYLDKIKNEFDLPHQKLFIDDRLNVGSKKSISLKVKIKKEELPRGVIKVYWLLISISVLAPVYDVWIGSRLYLADGVFDNVIEEEMQEYKEYAIQSLERSGLIFVSKELKEKILPEQSSLFIKKGEFTVLNALFFDSYDELIY